MVEAICEYVKIVTRLVGICSLSLLRYPYVYGTWCLMATTVILSVYDCTLHWPSQNSLPIGM